MFGKKEKQQIVMSGDGRIGFVVVQRQKETEVQFPLHSGESYTRLIPNICLDKKNEHLWKEVKPKR